MQIFGKESAKLIANTQVQILARKGAKLISNNFSATKVTSLPSVPLCLSVCLSVCLSLSLSLSLTERTSRTIKEALAHVPRFL